MNRSEALEQLKLRIENKNLIKHSFAVEAIMRRLAQYFHEDADMWGIAGLVHDIDLERVKNDMSKHGIMGGDILEAMEFDETIVYAVRAHNPINNLVRRRKIDKALFCADPVSGLITACALILPEKKLENVDRDFVIKRYYEKGFAKGANREQIAACSDLDLSLEEFVSISLDAMKGITDLLEL